MKAAENSEKPKEVTVNKCWKKDKTKRWQRPTLEDVSEKVMAQPYIRFT